MLILLGPTALLRNRRDEFDAKTRVKSELVLSSEPILKSLDKPRDSPGNGGVDGVNQDGR